MNSVVFLPAWAKALHQQECVVGFPLDVAPMPLVNRPVEMDDKNQRFAAAQCDCQQEVSLGEESLNIPPHDSASQ